MVVTGCHLPGSVPVSSEEEAFKQICQGLPGLIRRIPDGEPGARDNFVMWQVGVFPPELVYDFGAPPKEVSKEEVEEVVKNLPPLNTGYDDAAISSYAIFRKLRDAGTIPKGVRFQVCLPTVVNVICVVEPAYRPAVGPKYEDALFRNLERIQSSIPHADLAIQFDMPVEIAQMEGVKLLGAGFDPWFEPIFEGLMERIARMASKVEQDVELGCHLCYGDYGHQHWKQPKDLGICVKVAKGIFEYVKRPINWIHMPVPKDRDDDAYFAPLEELKPKPGEAELFLGLLHPGDEDGTKRKINAASKFVESFGVSTECGMGRCTADDMASIFQITRAVSLPYSS